MLSHHQPPPTRDTGTKKTHEFKENLQAEPTATILRLYVTILQHLVTWRDETQLPLPVKS